MSGKAGTSRAGAHRARQVLTAAGSRAAFLEEVGLRELSLGGGEGWEGRTVCRGHFGVRGRGGGRGDGVGNW